jgi:hypothetical protein
MIISNNIYIGCGIFILGIILAVIGAFGAIGEGLKGESHAWSNFFFGLFVVGLGLIVLGPLVWWIVLPIRNKIKRSKNAQ